MTDTLIQTWLEAGDEQAAEALYQTHRDRVYRLAYALLGKADDAELVMQETMVYALANIQLFDAEQISFDTWLDTITVSQSRAPQRSPHVGAEAEVTSSPARENHVWQALAQINPQLREAIVLRYWGDHTYPELAHILRCPLPTAQSRVRLGYEQMTKLLASAGKPIQGE